MMTAARAIDHLFIVGAGFSHNAGLPLTSNFTRMLLDVTRLALEGPSVLQVQLLKEFVRAAFSHSPNSPPESWPYLEDIFTCIDLSANSGHHLGPTYAPSDLRTVRRALIVRIIRMLAHRYRQGRKTGGEKWRTLDAFFSCVDPGNSAFLSMNWDTVIEKGLASAKGIVDFDYGCDAVGATFTKTGIKRSHANSNDRIQILKPHGSANWLYCDSCRELFWFPPDQTDKIADQLFKSSDWAVVEKFTTHARKAKSKAHDCPSCKASALGTRFATFSYRKALDFPMHGSSWKSAEKLLKEAKTWTFIGYSLPAADYEFKLLLKRVQLSRTRKPRLVLVTGGSAEIAKQTQDNYEKFFGPTLTETSKYVIMDGLDDAIDILEEHGILTKPVSII